MSTVSLYAARIEERDILDKLCVNRAKQLAELDELVEMHAKGEGILEIQNEGLSECIDDICKANALGTQGPVIAQLGRISARLARLEAEALEVAKLVQLCMKGPIADDGLYTTDAEKAILEEVARLKSQEVPF